MTTKVKEAVPCGAPKSLRGLELVCDLPRGHDGKHEDNSLGPTMHFAWENTRRTQKVPA